jgi:hypothetical protein
MKKRYLENENLTKTSLPVIAAFWEISNSDEFVIPYEKSVIHCTEKFYGRINYKKTSCLIKFYDKKK